jgi:cellulose synthase/poly-beta-1,6-N-acetylglucosamine synthase-like glycosyltransferase
MNINSYLGLLGSSYRFDRTGDGNALLSRCTPAEAQLIVPEADFVMILDADTIIAPDYTPTLMRRFYEPGGENLAVVQSPYSTFPGDRGVLQHVAGAQTDMQYLVHQGLTYYNATYWVGANALVRVAALRDLQEKTVERGFEIIKLIRDRTLIEDTDSTIDLVRKGWRLFNEPERLAFSMTPADFGSLLIQRRRWANGGLLIVPRLLAYLRERRGFSGRVREGVMRLHYLIALGPVSMALLVAFGVSFDERIRAFALAGTIYYSIYARDLFLIGYPLRDILRVFALNLALIPVNLMGMALSLAQAITGHKACFSRTPKILGRTRVPARYIFAEFALLGFCLGLGVYDMTIGQPLRAVFMLLHALFLAYAIGAFIGYNNAFTDILASATNRRKEQMTLRPSVNP